MKKSLFLNSKGFTLIEVIVCLILLGVIGTAVAMYFANAVEGFLLTKATNEASQKVNLALERLSREIKHMDYITQQNAGYICFSRDNTEFCIAKVGPEIQVNRSNTVPSTASAGNALIDNITVFNLEFWQGSDTTNGTWTIPSAPNDETLAGLSRVTITLTLEIFDNTTRTFTMDINPLYNNTVDSAT